MKSEVRLSGKQAHLGTHVGDAQTIHQSENSTVQSGEDIGSAANAHQRLIFFEGGIASPMKAIFNGTITNDKFCLSRLRQVQWKSACAARKDEVLYPSEGNKTDRFPQEDRHETTVLECSALHTSHNRCSATLESSVPGTRPLERESNERAISQPHRGGTHL